MDFFKKDNFLKANVGNIFPEYFELNTQEIDLLVRNLNINLFKTKELLNRECIVEYIRDKAIFASTRVEEDFSIYDLLKKFSLKETDNCYINWDNFNNVDKLSLKDLNDFWSDIWYPIVDDIEIIAEDLTWVVTITHYGSIGIMK
jgi:hypothetical protein